MTEKMAEQKMPDMENGRKYTDCKMAEKTQLENDRTENARYGKWQNENCLTWKMAKYTHTG